MSTEPTRTDETTTAQEFAVMGDWLVLRVNTCTCYGGNSPYGHEPDCGWDAVAKLDEVAPALERFWRDRIADEIAAKLERAVGSRHRDGLIAAERIARGRPS